MNPHLIIDFLTLYQVPALFVGAFFFGEAVILAAALLAQDGLWNIWTVFGVSFVATVVSDAICYYIGSTIFFKKKWFLKYENKYKGMVELLDNKVSQRPYLSLLIIKFLYGTRIVTILYLAVKEIGFWKFLLFDIVGTFVWLVAILSIGWFAGMGIGSIGLYHRLISLLVGLVICILVYQWFEKWVIKNLKKK